MRPYWAILIADFKNIKRDPILALLFMVPFIMLAFVRYAIPYFTILLPDMVNFSEIAIAFFCVMNANFPGFIVSFILLDEKDLQLFPVLKVQPVSLRGFLIVRMAFIIVWGFMGSVLILKFNGLHDYSIFNAVQIAILSALSVPVLTLIISLTAKNKVEGITLLKVMNITLVIPMVLFFIESDWDYVLSIFPAFWAYKLVHSSQHLTLFLIGFIYLLVLNILVFNFFNKKRI